MAFKMKGSSYKMGGVKTKSTMAYMKSPMKDSKSNYNSDGQFKKLEERENNKAHNKSHSDGLPEDHVPTSKARPKSPLEAAKPDYPDIDGDGNYTESMKKAAADKKDA